MNASKVAIVAVVALVAACADPSTAPAGVRPVPEVLRDAGTATGPHFLSVAAGAPSIANPVISFWAKRGTEKIVYMWYHAAPGQGDSTYFLRFKMHRRALAFYPNGQPFANGDSVRITVTLVDPVNQILDFQPSGLRFTQGNPPKLKLSYLETDPDWNDDGSVDQRDVRLQRLFRIWQLHTGLPWMALPSVVNSGAHEVEANIFGFTSYAVAY